MSDRGRAARRRLRRRDRRRSRLRRLIIWSVFGVLVSLVPLGFRWGGLYFAHAPSSPTDLLSTGDLIVIAMVVAASASGDLISRNTAGGIGALAGALIGLTSIFCMFAGWLYAIVTFDPSFAHGPDIVCFSIVTMVGSILVGASSIWVDTERANSASQDAP
jgi:hypothetical protein